MVMSPATHIPGYKPAPLEPGCDEAEAGSMRDEIDAVVKRNLVTPRQREILGRQRATAGGMVKAIEDANEEKEPDRGQVRDYR